MDFGAAVAWDTQLFGRSARAFVTGDEVMWAVRGRGHGCNVADDRERAGHALAGQSRSSGIPAARSCSPMTAGPAGRHARQSPGSGTPQRWPRPISRQSRERVPAAM